jgi:hypothetical protein
MIPATPLRRRSTLLIILLLWGVSYASFTLFTPPLLDDANSVHAEVAHVMLLRHDNTTLYADGVRYMEKAPLLYWAMAGSMRVFQLCGAPTAHALAVAARILRRSPCWPSRSSSKHSPAAPFTARSDRPPARAPAPTPR